jgi:hypothetical protein
MDGSAMLDWREEEVGNEVRSRERNEWILHANDDFAAGHRSDEYECECGYGPCTEIVSMTRAEYEGVRVDSTHFAIAPDHENPEFELVVSQNERFAVIEKLTQMPRRIARDTDPRH